MVQSDTTGAQQASFEQGTAKLVRIAASCVIAAAVVATLYLARPLLLPFALATLLAFALAPLVELLGKWRFPRGPAVICTVAFSVLIFASVATFIGTQLSHLVPDVPRYQATLLHKIESMRDSAARNDLIRNATHVFNTLDNAISGNAGQTVPAARVSASSGRERPLPVEIRQPNPGPLRVLETIADPMLLPLARAALIVIFVIFILLQKEDLRDRFISLAGARDLQRTTQAIDEGAHRLSRYLLLQCTVNACFGILITAGLWLIGIPSPALWGLIAGIARFVPYVGVPIASVLPLTLALALAPGWTMVLLTAVLFFGTEAVTGQFVEPLLYGPQTGLSPMAVVLCAVFWTWIWGPIGLLLSTPLTMCMAIIGRNVEHLRFLDVLLGNRAALTREEAFYLRMLAANSDEEAERAEALLSEMSLDDYFDTVAIRGLALAHMDKARGALDADGGRKICGALLHLLEDICDTAVAEQAEQADAPQVLCVAGRGELDAAAAAVLAAVLAERGIAARVIAHDMTSPLDLKPFEQSAVRAVCVSYLPPCNLKNARYLAKRLRKQLPNAVVIAGFWTDAHDDTAFLDALETSGCDRITTTLCDAATQIAAVLKAPPASETPAPAASSLRERARTSANAPTS